MRAPRLGWIWAPPRHLRDAPVGIAIAKQATMLARGIGRWECAACSRKAAGRPDQAPLHCLGCAATRPLVRRASIRPRHLAAGSASAPEHLHRNTQRPNGSRTSVDELALTAYHEASHAVCHFALENPRSPRVTIVRSRWFDGRYQTTGMVLRGFPSLTGCSVALAGRVGEAMACSRLYGTVPKALRAMVVGCQDDFDAVQAVYPDLQPTPELMWLLARRERRHVRRLLERNWGIVERVAAALRAERTLEEDRLRALIGDDIEPDYSRTRLARGMRYVLACQARQGGAAR